MKRALVVCLLGVVLSISTMLASATSASAEPMEAGIAFTKLARGAVNTVTGWVEIPKRVVETWQRSGPASGFTWGILRGFGYGYIRTAAGLYEIFTFPYPAPSGYLPVMEPEYVFITETATKSGYEY